MSKEEVIANMKKTLDWNAKEYAKYTDKELKADIDYDYRKEAVAYNLLLQDMYAKFSVSEVRADFPLKIVSYIAIRVYEGWK